jgi:predicted ATP-grasp superfamily ATP-dependent carboligase
MRPSDPHSYATDVPALILKVGRYPLHHGGLAAIRTLGRAGVPVHVVCEDRFTPAALSRYTARRLVPPPGTGASGRLLAGLLAHAERLGRPSVLIPTDDLAAFFIADHADDLAGSFLFARPVPGLARILAEKAKLADLTADVPRQRLLATPDDLAAHLAEVRFPVVAKSAPLLRPDGRRTGGTVLVRDRAAYLGLPTPVLIQEHVFGDDWLFHGYWTTEGECVIAGTGRKLRAFPARTGETALGRAEPNPELAASARALLDGTGYRGPVSMDFRRDQSTGRYLLFDVNPRLGAIFRLFTTTTGLDVVRATHLDLTGRRIFPGVPVDHRIAVSESNEVRRAWSTRRTAGLPDAWRAVRAADERAWLSLDDPVPPLAALIRGAVSRLG